MHMLTHHCLQLSLAVAPLAWLCLFALARSSILAQQQPTVDKSHGEVTCFYIETIIYQ